MTVLIIITIVVIILGGLYVLGKKELANQANISRAKEEQIADSLFEINFSDSYTLLPDSILTPDKDSDRMSVVGTLLQDNLLIIAT